MALPIKVKLQNFKLLIADKNALQITNQTQKALNKQKLANLYVYPKHKTIFT